MDINLKRSVCRASVLIIFMSFLQVRQTAHANSSSILTLLPSKDSRVATLATQQAKADHLVDFQIELRQTFDIQRDGIRIGTLVSATIYRPRADGAGRSCVVGWVKPDIDQGSPSLIELGNSSSDDCTAIAAVGIVETAPHVLVGVVTREGPMRKLSPHVFELTSGGLYRNSIATSRDVAALPADITGMRRFIFLYTTKEPFLTGPPAQAWEGSFNAGGGLLELIEDPDGRESAHLTIRNLGCIGGLDGLATESPHEVTVRGDDKQSYPADCILKLKRVGGDHLIYDSATESCEGLGGAGCEFYQASMNLHRVHSIPSASSTAEMYYYIRHHLP